MSRQHLDEFTLGQRVLYFREKRGASQRDIAKKVKITSAALSLIESDKRSPSVDVLRRLALVLDVSPAQFFIGDDVHVFDMKRLKRRYKRLKDLDDTVYRALDEVIRYAKQIKFLD